MREKVPYSPDETIILPSRKAVVPTLAYCEKVIGSRNPDVQSLMALMGSGRDKKILIRYTPSGKQRQIIYDGGDIYLCLQSFGNPMPPLMMFAGYDLDPANTVEFMELDIPFKILEV